MSILEDLGYAEHVRDRFTPIPDRGTRARLGLGAPPQQLEPGWSPFGPATLIANWAVDWGTLAPNLFVAPVATTHAAPTKGTASSLNLSDHDHGDYVGPATMDLAVSYASPGKPSGVTRTDTPGGAISTTVINYAGALIASIVTTKLGKTFTITPTYTGSDITALHRTVT